MLKRFSAPMVALSLAVIMVASAGTGAVAQRLIGSKDVADNSLTGKDVKNSSLTGKDVKNGSLSAADISGGISGAVAGPAGPQGARGETGAIGQQGPRGATGPAGGGPEEVLRWDARFASDGTTNGTVATSSEEIPKYSELKALDLVIDGDFSSCTGYMSVNFRQGNTYPALAYAGDRPEDITLSTVVALTDAPLRVTAFCASDNGPVPVPSFTASVVFQITQLDATVTRQFN